MEPLDLLFGGAERAIGVYLLETACGPALFDCGPSSTLPRLKVALRERGLEPTDVRHLLLSHVHLDHAGAAGSLVREHPALTVWVSEVGAPHVVDPTRLERSARRLYGDLFDPLWGELAPVPRESVRVAAGDVLGLDAFPTPGHASHHVSYLDADGTLYAGDAAGVRIQPSRYVLPVSPPPDIDVEQWLLTIDDIERRAPQRLALIHFGVFEDVADHLGAFKLELARWTELVGDGADANAFVEAAESAMPRAERPLYERAAPLWQCYQGLRRYWDKRTAAADEAR